MNKIQLPTVRLSLVRSVAMTLIAMSVLSACGGGNQNQLPSALASSTAAANGTKASTSMSAVTTKPSDALAMLANTLVTKEASIGAVTGFGSVIVEGVKYEDDKASVKLEIDPTMPAVGTLKDIKLGMRLAVQADGKQAQSFTLGSEVMGKVSSLGVDSVVVAGQTVKVSTNAATPTVFEGVVNLPGLALGDFIEVYGQRDALGVITASRIERKNPGSVAITRIAGNISAFNKTAKTFALGGLTVSFAEVLRVVPHADALVDGAKVAVFSNLALVGNTLNAKGIKVLTPSSDLNGLLRMGGHVRALDYLAKSFMLDGIKIDASKANFVKGTANDLANGVKVRVVGAFADGKVAATELSFQKDLGDAQVDVKGEITDFVTKASFKVRGVPFDASATTISFVNGDVSKLAAGVKIRVKGEVQGDTVKPVSIEFLAADAVAGSINEEHPAAPKPALTSGNVATKEVSFNIEGSIAQIDVVNKTLRLNGNTFNMPLQLAGAELLDALKNGTNIQLQGTVQDGQVVATKLVVAKN